MSPLDDLFKFNEKPKAPKGQSSFLEPEFEPHYTAWKARPSPETTDALLKALNPVMSSALRTYAGPGSPTLKSRAKRMVLDALPRYDPQQAKLRTHLMTNLQSLRRASADEQSLVHVPERIRLDQHHLYTANNELLDRLGREPSTGELAAHTGLSLKRLAHIRKARGSLAEGQVTGTNEEGEETGDMPNTVLPTAKNNIWERFIYEDLPARDQFIMEHVLGLHGKQRLPKGEIAKRLGISAGAVSQRAAKIQSLLDRREELGGSLFS